MQNFQSKNLLSISRCVTRLFWSQNLFQTSNFSNKVLLWTRNVISLCKPIIMLELNPNEKFSVFCDTHLNTDA